MNSTDFDTVAPGRQADALAWVMLAELTGCPELFWSGIATDSPGLVEPAPRDGGDR
ncbi:hypothetical protein ACFWP7_37780 [Streptomyces sp. NPDC058470]|uniref:hypothetical protein n=1 Tax=Streptomyces sp. NPDC058470 TaxID=3346515 RepID=UPI00364A64D2